MADWSKGLLGNPLFMMGLSGLGNSRNPAQGWMQGLLAQNQYGQQDLNNQLMQLKIQQAQKQLNQPAPRKILTDANGYQRYQDSGEQVFPGVQKQTALPGAVQQYMFAVKQGYKGTFEDWTINQKKASATNVSLNDSGQARILSAGEKTSMGLDPSSPYVWNSKGMPTPVKPTNYSEAQLSASGFADRMENAEAEMQAVTDLGFDPSTLHHALGTKVVGGNYTLEGDAQVFNQAQMDWVRAKLRKESGAVIGDQEMADEIKTYFPQPGDGQEVIASKARARAAAMRGMVTMTGGHYKPKGVYDRYSKKGDAPKAEPEKQPQETRNYGGRTYIKIDGEWYAE